MRKEFELTQEQLDKLMEASKPQPAMYLSGGIPMFEDQQARANCAWRELANELKFDLFSVRPVPGKDTKFFTAEIKE
jgi:aromatic ring-opening dioxygenase catalytic subunit (LigB family)